MGVTALPVSQSATPGPPPARPSSPVRRALALAAALTLGALAALTAPSAEAQKTSTVPVGDLFFCDALSIPGSCRTTVLVGDTIIWDYSSGAEEHTVTHCGDSCDTPTSEPLFDSGELGPGQTFSFTFDTPGTYLYHCRIHPEAMFASVVVVQPETSPTAPAASPFAEASPTPTPPAASGDDEDGDGVPLWAVLVASIGGPAALLAAGGALLLRRRA